MSNCSTVGRSQHSGGANTFVRHWSWAISSAASSSAPTRDGPGGDPLALAAVLRERATTRSSLSRGWLTVTQAVGPAGRPAAVSTLTAGRSARRLGRQGPEPGAVDTHAAVVVDHLAREQRPDHVHALAQPRVALRLRRPAVARDVLVDASPVPSATHRRPGNIWPAWRRPGRRSPGGSAGRARLRPRSRLVASSAAPRNDQASRTRPGSLQGEKWSEDIAAGKPACSACAPQRAARRSGDPLVRAVESESGHAAVLLPARPQAIRGSSAPAVAEAAGEPVPAR